MRPDNPKKTEVEHSSKATKEKRISSTDYNKWDKYDADVELLRIELDAEREKESIEIKNRRNQKTYGTQNEATLNQSFTEDDKSRSVLEQLTDIEKDKLAEE